MRKLCLLFTVLLAYSCTEGEISNPAEAPCRELEAKQAKQDSTLNRVGKTFLQIDSNLNRLKIQQERLMSGIEKGTNAPDSKDTIFSCVEQIKDIMAENNVLIEDLDSTVNGEDELSMLLDAAIGGMQSKMTSSNKRMLQINSQLSVLGDDFRDLFDEFIMAEFLKWEMEESIQALELNLGEMESNVTALEKQLNTAYYIVGTKEELIEKEAMTKGGLFKEASIDNDISNKHFVKVDKRKFSELALPEGKTKMISTHPSDAYEISTSGSRSNLKILDAKKFWSVNNYLIIQIK